MNPESPPQPDTGDGDLDVNWDVSPGMTAAINLARAEMKNLLAEHCGEWVAYCGDECGRGTKRLGFAQTEAELYARFSPNGERGDRFFTAVVMEGNQDPDEDEALFS